MLFFRKNKRQFGFRSHRRVFVAMFLLMFSTSVIVSLVMSARAEHEPVQSIEFFSDHTSFTNEAPGAWKVTKSVEWVDYRRARVTLNVESVRKFDDTKKLDIVMILDNSSSMDDWSKLKQVKEDSSELIDALLSGQDNRVSLITFNTSASILSNFTNDKNSLLQQIDNIAPFGDTNYYDALKKAEQVLSGYSAQNDRQLIILFLTDGCPSVQTPYEVAQYHILKQKYPNMIINGIQYEMGDELKQPIISISDNQYISDTHTLRNVLFDATIAPYKYETFTIEDYIDNGYWHLADMNNDGYISITDAVRAIDATVGNFGEEIIYDFDNDSISWDLSNIYNTGNTETLSFEIELNAAIDSDDEMIIPSNKRIKILSDRADLPSENIDSTNTPELKTHYTVTYNTAAPSGCDITNYVQEAEKYYVYTVVDITEAKPVCKGYSFLGWKMDESGVKVVNDVNFRMPPKDIVLSAVWGRPSISKSLDGTPHRESSATFDVGTTVNNKIRKLSGETTIYSWKSNETITSIERSGILSSAVNTNDSKYILSSSDSDIPIYGWFDNGVLYFYSEADVIYLNENPMSMFYKLSALTDISSLSDVKADKANNLIQLFYSNKALTDFSPISGWNVSNVTDLSSTFYFTGMTNTDALSNWDVSNVTNMTQTFYYTPNLTDLDGIGGWNMSNVTTTCDMFGSSGITTISALAGWKTNSLEDASYMFAAARSLSDISGLAHWNIKSLRNAGGMFSNDDQVLTNIDALASWDITDVTDISSMFYRVILVTDFSPIKNWNTENVTDMSYLFYEAVNMTDLSIVEDWDTSKVTNMSSLFEDIPNLVDLSPISGWETGNVTDMSGMFDYTGITSIDDLAGWDTGNVTTMSGMFTADRSLSDISGLAHWDISSLTDISGMFSSMDWALEDITPLSNWSTGNITDMSYLFGMTYISDVTPIGGWDTSSVTDMSGMFNQSRLNDASLRAIGEWNTENVEDMHFMFYRTSITSLTPLKKWKTGKVTDMNQMFGNNSAITSLSGLEDWDVSSVTNMSNMFQYVSNLTDISAISGWETSNVESMSNMFYGDTNITTFSPLDDWDVSSLWDYDEMFGNIPDTVPRPTWYENL